MFNVGFIPARGGSRGIKNKNIANCAGKPLIYWTLKAAQDSKLDKIFVSTDSAEIWNTVTNLGFSKVEPVKRSSQTAGDTATSESALIEFAADFKFDNAVFIQATSPLLTANDINGGLDKFINENYNSVISVIKNHQFIWTPNGHPLNYNPNERPRRQDWEGYYIENGAFYISSRENILKSKCRITPPVGFWEMDKIQLMEIDSIEDLNLAEKLLKILH